MTILNYIKKFINLLRVLHNYNITIHAQNWAINIRQIAHKFTAIEQDIKNGKYGQLSHSLTMVASNL